jgi:hypothetical protein
MLMVLSSGRNVALHTYLPRMRQVTVNSDNHPLRFFRPTHPIKAHFKHATWLAKERYLGFFDLSAVPVRAASLCLY